MEDRELLITLLGDNVYGLGIDQGYANLGCSIIRYSIKEDKFYIDEFKTIKTSSSLDLNKRLNKIYNAIEDILDNYPNEINIAGCEKLFHNSPMASKGNFGRNKSASIMRTNMATGVVYLLTAQRGIPIYEYAPTTVKKRVAGNGRATKEDVIYAVTEISLNQGVSLKTEHEADSIAIGMTAIKDYLDKVLDKAKEKLEDDRT